MHETSSWRRTALGRRRFPNRNDARTMGLALVVALTTTLAPPPMPAQSCSTLNGVQPQTDAFVLDDLGGFADVDPRVASNGIDTFVTVWNDGDELMAQRFDTSGSRLGGQITVADEPASDRRHSAIAAAPDGRFVVVWLSTPASGDPEVRARRFAANGAATGASIAVNVSVPTTGSFQSRPDVAIDGSGNWFVVWTSTASTGTDQSDMSIQGRRYAWSGTALTGQTQVNTEINGRQIQPMISMLPDGRAVVAYHNWQTGEARARRYDSNGSPLGNDFLVSTSPPSSGRTAVAMAPDGAFLVTWYGTGGTGIDADLSIQARLYSAAGTALGPQFQVNSGAVDDQLFPRAEALADGSYVVVWESRDQPGDPGFGIRARYLSSSGQFFGDDIPINQQTGNNQTAAEIAATASGSLLAVYYSDIDLSGDLTFEAHGRFFTVPIGGLFCDGFESGDTSAWSSSSP